jgi:predicted small lipoprotein YifL
MNGFERYGRLAVVVALVIGFGLGGCGRKGALDAPPSAAVAGGAAVAPQPSAEPADGFLTGRRAAAPPLEAPLPPTAARKSFFLDWLLN